MKWRQNICTVLCTFIAAAASLSAQASAAAASQQPRENVNFDNPFETERMLDLFDERFAVMDSLVFRTPDSHGSVSPSDPAISDYKVSERVGAIDEATEAQIRAMKARTGLELGGQAYVRPGRQISYDPDDPLVAYNAKLQAEVEWNIFHSSIYKRASKIRELRLEGELRQMEHERDALEETVWRQKMSMRGRYYGRMLTVLNVHAENLRLLMETQMFLLQNGKISSDDLLKLINEQAEVERQLIAIKADSVVTPLPADKDVAYVSVADTAALMSYMREEHRDVRKFALRDELLRVQRKNTDYLQTMNISPFVRASFYNRANAHNTHNIDVGVSFKIPLSVETARRRRALQAERNVVQYDRDRAVAEVEREVDILLRDLENYNENICGEYRRMLNLKRYLRMRIDSYGNVAGEYSRIDRLQEYNAYLQAWERMLEYAYRRDCRLVDLQSCIAGEPVSRFLIFRELEQ